MTTLQRTEPAAERTGHQRSAGEAFLYYFRRVRVWIPLALLAIWTVTPILITISVSLKARADVFGGNVIPVNPTIAAYETVLSRPGFQSAFMNSVIVGLGTSLLTLVIAVPAAYAFARYMFRGRHLLLLFTLLPRLIPGIGLMVPLYRLAVAVGALDSRLTLIVAFTGTILPLAVWLLVGFIRQIPRDLEEAGNVDGTSFVQRIRYIVLPLSVPALFTIGVLAFREAWNELDLVIGLTRSAASRTLPYELFLVMTGTGLTDNPSRAAFALLTLAPFVLIYLRIERYIVSGITSGAVK